MKLTKSQLKSIKSQVKSNKIEDETPEDEIEEMTTSMRDVKKALKELDYNDETSQRDLESLQKEVKRNLRRKARKENKVSITWDVMTGDAVKFKNRTGNEEIGIVISQLADGEYKDLWRAKHRATIKIMSSSGTFWISPTKIEKLEE